MNPFLFVLVRCPYLWQPVDNKCVLFVADTDITVAQAKKICADMNVMNGYTFVIDSEEQNQLATDLLMETNNTYMVLGCSDVDSKGTWRCNGRTRYLVQWTEEIQAGYWSKFHNSCTCTLD